MQKSNIHNNKKHSAFIQMETEETDTLNFKQLKICGLFK